MVKGFRFYIVLLGYVVCAALVNGAAPAQAKPYRLLILGDSLSAGFNLPHEWAFPNKLEEALKAKGHDIDVINAAVSGDTTAGGLARLDWVIQDRPNGAIVELGGNDGLRGLDPAQTAANLAAIIQRLQKEGVAVMLAGMLAPPNLGKEYSAEFNSIYPRLAETHGTALYPFILKGVIDNPRHLQPDGIHPNMPGVAAMVADILPYVEQMVGAP